MDCSSYTYQVFLGFRGEDTRKNFTDHLHDALIRAEIVTFRDKNSIPRGENIELEIRRAIEKSQMSVVVLSKDYASSRWCLDELVMIMDRKRTAGHIVLPVFYDVDPSEVEEQTGNYAEAFAIHRHVFHDDLERVEKWKATLKEVASLKGMPLEDRYETQFIADIVQEVQTKVNPTADIVQEVQTKVNSTADIVQEEQTKLNSTAPLSASCTIDRHRHWLMKIVKILVFIGFLSFLGWVLYKIISISIAHPP